MKQLTKGKGGQRRGAAAATVEARASKAMA